MIRLCLAIISLLCISGANAFTVTPEPKLPKDIAEWRQSQLACTDGNGKKLIFAQYLGQVGEIGARTRVFIRTTTVNGKKIAQREELRTDAKLSITRFAWSSVEKKWFKYDDSEHKEAHEQFLTEMHTTDKEYQALYKSCIESGGRRSV